MERKTHKIILLTSPFHLKQLKKLSNFFTSNAEIRIAYPSLYISKKDVEELCPHGKIYPFVASEMQLEPMRIYTRVANLLRKPMKMLADYRAVIQKNRLFIKNLLTDCGDFSSLEIIIFNDRDFLTQLTLDHVSGRRNLKVTAIDEGLGYYIKEGFRQHLLRMAYKIVTPFLLGFNYRFIDQYGTHPMIDEVYLRFPDQLKKRAPNVIYRSFPKYEIKKFVETRVDNPRVLLFSTLLSEDNYMSSNEETKFYKFLSGLFAQNGISLVWRPHPREREAKIEKIKSLLSKELGSKFNMIPSNVDSESIDFSSFDRILNFGSTLVLYILETGFSPEKIITLRLSPLNQQTLDSTISFNFHKSREKLRSIFTKMAAQYRNP